MDNLYFFIGLGIRGCQLPALKQCIQHSISIKGGKLCVFGVSRQTHTTYLYFFEMILFNRRDIVAVEG
jgi:hypothetical protein